MEEIVVVKYGSSCISKNNVKTFAKHVAKLRSYGKRVLIVSSGSVKLGKELKEVDLTKEMSLRVWAALGSAQIVEFWRKAFEKYKVPIAQILVTHADLKENSYLKSSLEEILSLGIVAVVNENDVLSDTELMKLNTGGDNDGLAAQIATMLGAEQMILISAGVKGYLVGRKVVSELSLGSVNTEDHFEATEHGRGGIESKLESAGMALRNGVKQVFYAGVECDLIRVLEGKEGTKIKS
jgi:glutamate 5-kinase